MNFGLMDLRETFLSAGGRLARTPFLIAAAILISVVALYQGVVHDDTAQWLTGGLVYIPALFCGVCIVSKRLHDRGRSGWWAALVLTALVALWPHPDGFFGLLFILVAIWAVVELGVMPGEQGANRYGPNPLAEAASA
jgi:uncharacterized membrane protein YhaH (DUF805 family)